MNAPDQSLLIISRDLLLELEKEPSSELVFRQLANLNRRGFNLLLTASAPDRWVPTRGNVDNALQQQGRIQGRVRQAGGDLDGIYYVPRSLLTQDRNRTGALRDILQRYALEANQALLLSSSIPFLKAARRVGIEAIEVSSKPEGGNDLLEKLKTL